ncbi:hypothetical protein NIES4075_60570 [Tolypothrix sp. NIES-4075]|uniref:hypothetical protein n=1 Tax=Tolypothrix sp. NIES-4075 TaxID=2005459 RepID=UPI000B5CC064|nr:hypothetical protein [Tolypothrix sp. NIES-4075]GAX45038.1 hypothetical protein NIES4075_60570 [Tolypothrix sp. NIES-4075]
MKQNLTPIHNFSILDEIIAEQSINQLSLNPKKTLATSFVELGSLVTAKTNDIQLITFLQNSLERVISACLDNFPENIFWDFDFLVSSMLRQALVADDAVEFLKCFGNKIVSLLELCGVKTKIRFRYVHDFMYGFEWARWVQKEPETRANEEPFSLNFLDYLLAKAEEILQLICQEKANHYKLCDKGYRNPYCFSREPEDEHRMLSYLAVNQLIPVTAWNWNAQPVWNKPFQQLREELSLKLNIPNKN